MPEVWTAELFKGACEILAFDASGMLQRTCIEGRVSPTPGAAREVALLARTVAEETGMRTWLRYRGPLITITFERPDPWNRDRPPYEEK